MSARVLVVDDDAEMCRMLEAGLARLGHAARSCTSADEAYERVLAGEVDVLVTDLRMRGMNGLELCARVVDNRRDVPVIVMTGFGSLETAIATIRAGAFDFLQKPLDADALAIAVERALAQRKLHAEVRELRRTARAAAPFAELVGTSAPMRQVYELVERVAETDATVLVTGESGTGKELVARALH
ncbi:MAG TPA: response regulator, partial [Minicystis sp.]|nr:response regulator [Minicystis sp.]